MRLAKKLKIFFKDSVLYGIGDALGRLISLIMLPILSRAFVPADYGAIDLLTVSYSFILIGLSFNVYPGISKQFYKISTDERRVLLSSSCVFTVLITFACCMVIYIFSEVLSRIVGSEQDLSAPIKILALCLPFELIFQHLQLLLRLEKKVVLFTLTNIARVITMPLLVFVMVVVFDKGILGVFMSKIITLSCLTLGTFFILRDNFTHKIDLAVYKKLLAFTLPGYPDMVIRQLMDVLPRSLLAFYAPLTAVGLFGIASRVSKILNIFVMAFNRSWSPFAFEHADKPEEKKIYSIIFKTYTFTIIVLTLILSLFSKEVIMILTPKTYHSAFYLVAGIAFYRGLRGMTLMFGTSLYVSDKVKWTSYLNILQLVIFIACTLVLIPRFGTAGLILSLNIAGTIYVFLYGMKALQYFKFEIPYKELLVTLAIGALSIIFFNSLTTGILLGIILKSFFVAFFIYSGLKLVLSKSEHAHLRTMLKSKFPRLSRNQI